MLDEAARLGGGEGFVERGGLVGVEIVLHQHDLRHARPTNPRQGTQVNGRFGVILN